MAERSQAKPTGVQRPPVIVKKIKRGHGGHHGGAWKVAYADFVTAMMALFIVLWIVGQSQEVKQNVGAYFRDPGGFTKYTKLSIVPPVPGASQGGKATRKKEDLPDILREQMLQAQKQTLEQVEYELQEMIARAPEFARLKDQIDTELTNEGLRIELLEKENSSFFELGSARLERSAIAVLNAIATEVRSLPNPVVIEGHTDCRPYSMLSGYSNWELSTDRANTARRVMESFGLPAKQTVQVRGYADKKPRYPEDPCDVRNRRVSIAILYDLKSESENLPRE